MPLNKETIQTNIQYSLNLFSKLVNNYLNLLISTLGYWLYVLVLRYLSLSPTRQNLIQGLFYCCDFKKEGSLARALLDYVGHRLTGCNVSQVTLLDMDSLSLIWVHSSLRTRMPAHCVNQTWSSCAMRCLSIILRPQKVARPEPEAIRPRIHRQLDTTPGTNARRPI